MSASLVIRGDGLEEIGKATSGLFGAVTGKKIRKGMGGALRLRLIDHFTRLQNDSTHHRSADRLGANRSGFYADAARNVQMPKIESNGISVGIAKLGLRMRYYGGTVKPGKGTSWKTGRPTQWLAVPNAPEAYGKRTQEFDFSAGGAGNLTFVFFRPNLAALVQNLSTVIKRDRKGVYRPVKSTIGAVIFWLKKSITFKPDPSVLPTSDEMVRVAVEAADEELLRVWERQIGGTTT